MKLIISVVTGLLITSSPSMAENRLALGLTYGRFVPADWRVQGFGNFAFGSSAFGAGSASEWSTNLIYCQADWQIRFESGYRLHSLDSGLPQGPGSSAYKAELRVLPLSASFVMRTMSDYGKPAFFGGAGLEMAFISWDQQRIYYSNFGPPDEDRWESSGKPFGIHILGGFDYPLHKMLYLESELRYSYLARDWKLEAKTSGDEDVELKDINVGGTAMRFGLGYKF